MRRASYDLRKVICPHAHCIGYSSNVAKPGYWLTWQNGERVEVGRMVGRIARTEGVNPADCAGWILSVRLICENTAAHCYWVNPSDVIACYENPPAALLAWITGPEWVKNKSDIARIVAMSEFGTMSEPYIASRHDPEKAYNARPEYVAQFILKD